MRVFGGLVTLAALVSGPALAAGDADLGRHLTTIAGCHDCHTPGVMVEGKPDMARMLSGGRIGFMVPPLGVVYPPNLTPDPTGLGDWSEAEIAETLKTGTRPDGRQLHPIMPWMNTAQMTDAERAAIAAFLKSLPPIANKVPDPVAEPAEAPLPFLTLAGPPLK